MKKLFLCAVSILLIVACSSDAEIGTKINAEEIVDGEIVKKIEFPIKKLAKIGEAETDAGYMKTFTYKTNGVKYQIFSMSDSYEFGSVYVINVTKEELEIELLKLQIEKIKGQ